MLATIAAGRRRLGLSVDGPLRRLSSFGAWVHRHVIVAGVVASLIASAIWAGGPAVWRRLSRPAEIPNPLAEKDGLRWDAVFYPNKELKEPVVLEGKMKGARNGLRVDWSVGSPDRVPSDFFSTKIGN